MFIALHRAKGFISSLIRWQSRGDYSHASIVLETGSGVTLVESREFVGVRQLEALSPRPGEAIDLFEVDAPLPDIEQATAWLFSQLGKKYDYGSVLRFISRRQQNRTGSGKWFCSELAFAFVKKAGCDLLLRIEPWAVDPNRLSQSPLLFYRGTISGLSFDMPAAIGKPLAVARAATAMEKTFQESPELKRRFAALLNKPNATALDWESFRAAICTAHQFGPVGTYRRDVPNQKKSTSPQTTINPK